MKIESPISLIHDPIRDALADIIKNLSNALANDKLDVEDFLVLLSSFAEIEMSKKDWRHFMLFELLFEYAKDLAINTKKEDELEVVLAHIKKVEQRILFNYLLSRLKSASRIPPVYYWYRAFRMLEFVFSPEEIEELREYIKLEQKKQRTFFKIADKEFAKEIELVLEDFEEPEEAEEDEEIEDLPIEKEK